MLAIPALQREGGEQNGMSQNHLEYSLEIFVKG